MVAVAAKRSPPPCWSDLHPELLGLVLRRLSSLADRVRLRAALLEAPPVPPPLPWIALPDATFLSVPAGRRDAPRVVARRRSRLPRLRRQQLALPEARRRPVLADEPVLRGRPAAPQGRRHLPPRGDNGRW
jgi:hypothetical protein